MRNIEGELGSLEKTTNRVELVYVTSEDFITLIGHQVKSAPIYIVKLAKC